MGVWAAGVLSGVDAGGGVVDSAMTVVRLGFKVRSRECLCEK